MVNRRAAFSMIELIMAIVVIAVVVAGVPQILQRNVESMAQNLVQEDLFSAARTASQVLTYPWDDNSPDSTNIGTELAYSRILDVGGGNFARDTDAFGNPIPWRVGGIQQDWHRKFHDTNGTDTVGSGGANISGWGGDGGYIDDSGVFPLASASGGGGATNMKIAIITVGDVTLRVYAANIGEIQYAKRTFQ